MSAEANKALVERYLNEVWAEGNPDALASYAAAGYRRHISPKESPLDTTAQIARMKDFRTAFPDVSVEVEDIVAEDHVVAFRATVRGTNLGEWSGFAPTGNAIEVGLVDFMEIEDGKIVKQWSVPNVWEILKQLGGSATFGD